MESIWDWACARYHENGQDFLVATQNSDELEIRDNHLLSDLSDEEMPLVRNGKYLLPISRIRGFIKPHYMTRAMFSAQRQHLNFRESDVVVLTYQRSGTTWTEQLVLLLLHAGNEAILNTREKNAYRPDVPGSRGKLYTELLFREDGDQDLAAPWGTMCGQDSFIDFEEIEALRPPRLFKTHTTPELWVGNGEQKQALQNRRFPKFASSVKIVYVIRDPKDVAVSWYLSRNSCNFNGHGWPFTPYLKLFLDGTIPNGSWFAHTKKWLKVAEEFPDNFLILTYEEMKKAPFQAAVKVCEFLGLTLDEKIIKKCVELSSFDRMKQMAKDAKANHVRAGSVGEWSKYVSEEALRVFNKMLNDPALGEYGKRYVVKTRDA